MALEGEDEMRNEDKDRLLPQLSINEDMQGNQESKFFTYAQCYFVTIAATLGTGILGLPVKLANSGFKPFVVVFVLGFFAQVIVVYYFVEILQKSYVIKQEKARKESMLSFCESVPLNGVVEDVISDSADEPDKEVEIIHKGSVQVTYEINGEIPSLNHYPSLHSLAELFLSPGLQQVFDLAIVLVLVSCLISYSLAGSQAYAQLGKFELLHVIPVFTSICSFIVIFLQTYVTPFVSFLTFCKGSLFTACILAAMYVGYYMKQDITEDFWSAGEPFLLGTVAIGGIINIMPMVFTKIRLQASQIVRFRLAINSGLATCMILNIFWCYAVLKVVPQKECEINSAIKTSFLSSNNISSIPLMRQHACSLNGSLQWAEANGKISTIPLTEILQTKYTEFTWIALLIQIFVMISITVSFLTLGAALRHMLEGWFDSFFTVPNKIWDQHHSTKGSFNFNRKSFLKTLGLLMVFSFVFVIAMFNPKAFIIVMEKVTSLIINLETFIVVTVMLHRSRARKYRHLGIPVRLSRMLQFLSYPVAVYFIVAVGYDMYGIILHTLSQRSFPPDRPPPEKPPLFQNNHSTTFQNYSAFQTSSHSRRWRLYNSLSNITAH